MTKEEEEKEKEENGYAALVKKRRNGGRVVKSFRCCKKRIDARITQPAQRERNGTERNGTKRNETEQSGCGCRLCSTRLICHSDVICSACYVGQTFLLRSVLALHCTAFGVCVRASESK